MIFLDSETCGLHGMIVLIQSAVNDGEIYLHEVWRMKISSVLKLIESFANHKDGICGFNLAFDMFHINKLYNVFKKATEVYPGAEDWFAEDHIQEIAMVEKSARDGVCVKPVKAIDLFLYARKGEYQSTMERSDIRIKRVPKQLARALAEELNRRITFNKLYFARRKTELENPWQLFDTYEKGDRKNVDPNFKDIVLKFAPSSGLKALSVDVGLVEQDKLLKFTDIECKVYPVEVGWAPFAEAIGSPNDWKGSWPDVIQYHIDHFACVKDAREYSRLDIVYTRGLYYKFGKPEAGDDDSELACAIGAIRWKGFAIDVEGIKKLKVKALELQKTAPRDPGRVKDWIWPDLEPDEQEATKGSTGKVILEAMREWTKDCTECNGEGNRESAHGTTIDCSCCNGKGAVTHPAAIKAAKVLDARKAKKEVELYDKLLQAGRLHASFKVIGTLSGRMSGADKLNPQGIKSTKEVRSKFPLAFAEEMEELCGGDFEAFEVVIAVAIYKDPKLEEDLNTLGMCPGCLGTTWKLDKFGNPTDKSCVECKGTGNTKKKIHGLFGSVLFEKEYDDIVASKGSKGRDMYTDGKRGVFSQLYGGNYATLMDKLGVSETIAKKASDDWGNKYTGIKKAQQRIFSMFCSMQQPKGIGSKVEWHEPSRYIESLLGFRRYYDLENRICKVLFELAENPPKPWLNIKVTVRRRDRDQTATGAVRSALFGAAFQIQAANLRSATNHEIQSTGAGICKRTQRKIWELQPSGVHFWVVRPMNIHDEIMCPCKRETKPLVEKIVREQVEFFRPLIPMIAIDYASDLKTWADK